MALCLPREVDEAVEEVGAAQPAYSPQGVNSGSSAEYAGKSGEYAGRVNTVALLPVFPEYFSLGDTITRDKAKPGNSRARGLGRLHREDRGVGRVGQV